MKRVFLAIVCALAAAGPARAQKAGDIGAGVIIGSPIGVTGKYWLSDILAIDIGAGGGDGHFVGYADLVAHAWNIIPQPSQGKLGLYVSAGPRFQSEHHREFGVRAMGGVDYWIQDRPIELFLEAGPVFKFGEDHHGVGVDGGLGVRFYFSGAKR